MNGIMVTFAFVLVCDKCAKTIIITVILNFIEH